LGEDGVQIEVPLRPLHLRSLLIDHSCCFLVDTFPLATTLNTIPEILHALLYVSIEHIINVYTLLTSLYDFIGNLMQKPRYTFLGIVVLGVLPNHSHSIEQTRQEIGYFFWRGRLQLLAWFVEALQEVQVVLCLHRPNFYVLCDVFKGLDVLRVYVGEYLYDALQFRFI
jgi:hypothetical protein